MKPIVFIHTNNKQMLGAKIARHALKRNSATPDQFEVVFLSTCDYPLMEKYEGQKYLRGSEMAVWRNDNLQSFTLLRFLPPQLMNYHGRAIVMDPDIFAIGDVCELLTRDMADHAIMCRVMPLNQDNHVRYASSLMLLDCSRLTHWKVEEQIAEMFACRRDYYQWIQLRLEPEGNIGLLEEEWNHFDTLTPQTKMLHNTERLTQPWKTGLPIDFHTETVWRWKDLPRKIIHRIKGEKRLRFYQPHPDPHQEALFLTLLRECLEQGSVTPQEIEQEIFHRHVRADILRAVEQTRHL